MAARKKPDKVKLQKPVIRRSSKAAEKKPIISVGTLVTVVVFAALVLLGIYLNRQPETAEAEATPEFTEIKYLFDDANGLTLSSIQVNPGEGSEGGAVKLVHDADNTWAFDPPTYEADQGLAESAASQVFALEIVDLLGNVKASDFGFDPPAYALKLEFSDGSARVVEVGDASPVNTGYYVRVDNGPIQLVRLSGIDALTQLAKTPPYAVTPEPEATPTP